MRDREDRGGEALIGLGSNLHEPLEQLRAALDGLGAAGDLLEVSSVYRSRAVGWEGQPDFLNAVVSLRTELSARRLLALAQELEAAAGREPQRHVDAPRPLDVDLLFVGDLVLVSETLVLPHPRFRDRRFVLEPLVEVAPGRVDPVTGRTVAEILDARRDLLACVERVASLEEV